ncbi:sn-glycerol 3-phosphate transport system substrate-binding protein [Paenibacillus sp. UNCCL117]|uniref:ABC transporter substrate-binding protein n=1 Tax=unclassified Paenibacillus TaxID=185978 RepID=UPI00087EC9E8|nr:MULTISPECIES: ABC transporter substrate-binding protein [unclassified Paenibacillus]SDE06447.1 sn-glycerol 3-phosphate transport system substrate-binding protein [Paenibacillus sp. cl123]SFW59415.1 sn-glycerol 3-phosphate transport system substrate-binding protein [Paenibacillus sp. UNCCL117]
MKNNKWFALLGTALSLILVFLAGCSGNSATPGGTQASASKGEVVELVYYFPTQTSGPLAVAMEKIVEKFNAANKDIHVTATFTGNYDETLQKTLTAISGGNAPNVVLSGYNLSNLLSINALVDMNTLIAKEPSGFLDDYVPGFFTLFSYPGNVLYGMPFQHSGTILYYNKDILAAAGLDPKKPPATWSELKTVTKALKAYNAKLVPFEFMGDNWMTEALALSNGGAVHKDIDNMSLDNPKLIETVTFFKELMDAGLAQDNTSYGGAAENFLAGTTAIMTNSSGSLGNVSKTATFDWGIAPLPAGDGKKPVSLLGGGGFIIIGKHPQEKIDASWKFVKYMTSPEVSAEWMTATGYFAVRKSSYDLPQIKDMFAKKPQYATTVELLPILQSPFMIRKNFGDVSNVFKLALDESFLKKADIPATLQRAQKEAQALLDTKK